MIVVLGGGVSGLSAAHYLVKRFPLQKIALYEASKRTGGWIKTTMLPNGVKFEQGPHTLRLRGEAGSNMLELIHDIGLLDEIVPVFKTSPAAQNRMIYAGGELHTLPSTLMDLFQTKSPFKKPLISYVLNDLKAKKKVVHDGDESLYDFVERRFGNDIAKYAVSPLVCGICAGDAKEISVKFLMDSMFEQEQKYGSITRGMLMNMFSKTNKTIVRKDLQKLAKNWSIYSFRLGMEMLPETLEIKNLEDGVDMYLNSSCKQIEFTRNRALLHVDGVSYEAKHVISSIPAKNLAELVNQQHHVLANMLRKIPFVDVGVVTLQYNKILDIPKAFGFLVPPSEKIPILGVIFDSCCFPDNKNTVLTVMMGGKWYDEWFTNETELLPVALEYLERILYIKEWPTNTQVNLLKQCIPQYIIGHNKNVKDIENYIKNYNLPLKLCGSSYYGVGVNAVILSAKQAVMAI